MTPRRPQGLLELLGISEAPLEPGAVRCSLRAGVDHQNIQGVVHGVIPMALLDTAMGHALDGLLEPGEFCSTTQISFQFLRAVRPGAGLVAEGRVTRKGRRVAHLEGVCEDDEGRLIARAQGTWYVGRARTAPQQPDAAG